MSDIGQQFDPRDLRDFPDPETCLQLLARTVDHYYAEFRRSKYRESVLAKIKEGRKKYEQGIEKVTKPWPDACGLIGPVTALAVDSIEPKIWQSLVGQEEIIRYDSPRKSPEYDAIIEFDNYWLVHEIRIKKVMGHAIRNLVLDGTIYLLAEWERTERTERDFARQSDSLAEETRGDSLAITPEGSIPTKDFSVPEYEGGKLTVLPFEQVFIPDNIDDDDWDSCPLIRPIVYTFSELRRFQERGISGWINIDDDLRAQLQKTPEEIKTTIQESKHIEQWNIDSGVWCLQFHGEFDIDGDGKAERIIAAKPLNTQKIIYLASQLDHNFKNQKNIRRLSIFREMGLSYGCGIPQRVSGLQHICDATLRRIFNATDLQLSPFCLADVASLGLKEEKPQLIPGVIINCQNPEKANLVTFPGDATRYLVLIETVFSLLERMISSPDYTSASSSAMGVKTAMATATGTMALLSEGNLKHDYKGRQLQEQFLEVLKLLHNIYYQNMPMMIQVETLGMAISKQQMAFTPNFALVAASSTSNKFLNRQETQELVRVVNESGLAAYSNPQTFMEDILDTYGKKNKERYFDPQLANILKALVKQPGLRDRILQLLQMQGGPVAGAEPSLGMPNPEGVPA